MGCVNSASRSGPSSPVHEQAANPANPVHPYAPPEDNPDYARVFDLQPAPRPTQLDRVQARIRSELGHVLRETSVLVDRIGLQRAESGECLRPVHENAIELRNRIQARMESTRGSGADDYRARLATINQDFLAVSTLGAQSSRYFDGSHRYMAPGFHSDDE